MSEKEAVQSRVHGIRFTSPAGKNIKSWGLLIVQETVIFFSVFSGPGFLKDKNNSEIKFSWIE